jgi:hypothetical protein
LRSARTSCPENQMSPAKHLQIQPASWSTLIGRLPPTP